MREFTPERRTLEVELAFRVGTYDIDFAGVVSNIVYIRWLEDLRLRLLDEYLPLQEQVENGLSPVLTSTRIEYRRPIRLFDRPHGRMGMTHAGRARWTVEAEILVDGQPAATAVQTGAFVSLTTLRPVPLPEALRVQFQRSRQEG
jgi:acyl-CoA thioester hydrolase